MIPFGSIMDGLSGGKLGLELKLIQTLLLIMGLIIGYMILAILIRRRVHNHRLTVTLTKVLYYVAFVLGLVLVLKIWTEGVKSLGTFFGLLSAGVAISLKDVITNVAGWVYLLSKRIVRRRDRIEIQGVHGDVLDIKVLSFTMMEVSAPEKGNQSTGRIVQFPNAILMTAPLVNYSKGFSYIWDDMTFTFGSDADWRKAKSLIASIFMDYHSEYEADLHRELEVAKKSFGVLYRHVSPCVYVSITHNIVSVTARHMVAIATRRFVQSSLTESVITALDEAKIALYDPSLILPVTKGDGGVI